MSTLILLYILIGLAAALLIYNIVHLAKVQVWINKRHQKGAKLSSIGYLKMDNDGSAGEVRLPGGGSLPSIGRVIVDKQAGKELGFVEVVTSDIEDETATPKYKQAGFIAFNTEDVVDKYGYIYRQEKGKRKKELIGYCARPSDPNTPTIYGERTWHSLWLRCTLNVYAGLPTATVTPADTNKANAEHHIFAANEDSSNANHDTENDTQLAATAESNNQELAIRNDESDNTANNSAEPTTKGGNETQNDESPVAEAAPKDDKQATADQAEVEKETEDSTKDKKTKKAKRKKAKKAKKITKEALASVSYLGFHSSRNDYLPAEARACAYAALASNPNRGRYAEYFKTQPYGWLDTALLSSLIYCVFFFILYFFYEVLLNKEMINNEHAISILVAMYYVIWAVVRLIKIDCIESSNSFQKRLDIFNKNLGLTGVNITTLIVGFIAILVAIAKLNLEFIPLIWVIMFGTFTNMMLKGANKKWIISTSFNDKDDTEEDEQEAINPTGDIERTYEWELDKEYSTRKLHGSVTLYFTAQEIADVRQCNPFFAQRKDKSDKEYIIDMFRFLTEHKHFLARVKYIARYINETIKDNNLTPIDKIQFTLDFVQEPNISFVANRDSRVINNYEHYIRYPDETLYDKEGECNSKSLLAAVLFYSMGYNVMYLASRKHNHSAIGVEIDPQYVARGWYGNHTDDMTVTEGGKMYIYCETTGDRFRIGRSISGMHISDFETKVILEVESNNQNNANGEKSVIYNWDLDSILGNTLHGNLTLKFSRDDIERIRENNPFMTYGADSNTYASNISNMFSIMRNDNALRQNVETIAQYIKHEIGAANLPEIDLLQFVLNFVQTPNIAYRIDEECESIGFKNEYMRFPDETLYDKEGDCDCKSFLTANILSELGYNVAFLLSNQYKHAAIAVECSDELVEQCGANSAAVMEYNGRKYVFCESTGSGNKVGNIKEEWDIANFETVVELLR